MYFQIWLLNRKLDRADRKLDRIIETLGDTKILDALARSLADKRAELTGAIAAASTPIVTTE